MTENPPLSPRMRLREAVVAEGGTWTVKRAISALGVYPSGGTATSSRARAELGFLVEAGLLVRDGSAWEAVASVQAADAGADGEIRAVANDLLAEAIDTAAAAGRLIAAGLQAAVEAGFEVFIDQDRIKVIRGSSSDHDLAEVWEDVDAVWHVTP